MSPFAPPKVAVAGQAIHWSFGRASARVAIAFHRDSSAFAANGRRNELDSATSVSGEALAAGN